MKKLAFQLVLSIVCFVACDQLIAQQKKYEVRSTAPEGTIIGSKGLIAKKGFKFDYASEGDNTKVVLKRMGNGIVSGEFSCNCHNPQDGGSCQVIISDNQLHCFGGTCASCQMIVKPMNNAAYMLKLR